METIISAMVMALVALTAWLARFAIKEYDVFKSFAIPSKIFANGLYVVSIITFWNIAANYVYSRMIQFVPKDKIAEINNNIQLRGNKYFVIYYISSWLFIWFVVWSIDMIANEINKARKQINN